MQHPTVLILAAAFVGFGLAQDYSTSEDTRTRNPQTYSRPAYTQNLYEDAKAEPYDFGFQSTDEYGTVMNRQEASDNNGAVRGSYGYTDPYGVFRHVDYIADEYGFRAQVKSNEPGMGSQSPANVEIYAEAPPAGVIIERPYYVNQIPTNVGGQGNPPRRPAVASNPVRQNRPPTVPTSSSSASSSASSQSTSSSTSSRAQPAAIGPFPFVASRQNPYPSSASIRNQYPYQASAAVSSQFPSEIARYPGPNPYPTTDRYAPAVSSRHQQPQAYSDSSPSSTSSASSANTPGVYRYPVGNPQLTSYVRSDEDKPEGAAVLLPTVVSNGAPTTLVKHIHTYPVTAVQ